MKGWIKLAKIALLVGGGFVFIYCGNYDIRLAQSSPLSPNVATGEIVAERWKSVTIYMRPADAHQYELDGMLCFAVLLGGFAFFVGPLMLRKMRGRGEHNSSNA